MTHDKNTNCTAKDCKVCMTKSQNNCCEKCHGYFVEPKHEYFPLCGKKDCPCHSQAKEEKCPWVNWNEKEKEEI